MGGSDALGSTSHPSVRRILTRNSGNLADDIVDAYTSMWSPFIRRDENGLVVRASAKRTGFVGLVIGNGLGHEPAMMGLVGEGLFDVNVPGELFAAPGPLSIAAGVRAADRGAGVLLCVSNHAGDVLSAEMAMSMLEGEQIDCRSMCFWDDISTAAVHGPDRRGGPGLLFVWKILGAAAESGFSIDECERIGHKSRDAVRSLSAVLGGTMNPETGHEVTPVNEGFALVGAGVHGDRTGEVVATPEIDSLAIHLVERVARDLGLAPGDRCGLVINDAGAMSVLESSLLGYVARQWLESRGVRVDRTWCGRYATTLATAGVGVALCRLDDELTALWDAPCHSAAMSSRRGVPHG